MVSLDRGVQLALSTLPLSPATLSSGVPANAVSCLSNLSPEQPIRANSTPCTGPSATSLFRNCTALLTTRAGLHGSSCSASTIDALFRPRATVPARPITLKEIAQELNVFMADQGINRSFEDTTRGLRSLAKRLPLLKLTALPFDRYDEHKLTVLSNLFALLTGPEPRPYQKHFLQDLETSLGTGTIQELLLRGTIVSVLSDLPNMNPGLTSATIGVNTVELRSSLLGSEVLRELCLHDPVTFLKVMTLDSRALLAGKNLLGPAGCLELVRRAPLSTAHALFALSLKKIVRQLIDILGNERFKAWISETPEQATRELSHLIDQESEFGSEMVEQDLAILRSYNDAFPDFIDALLRDRTAQHFNSAISSLSGTERELMPFLEDPLIRRIACAHPKRTCSETISVASSDFSDDENPISNLEDMTPQGQLLALVAQGCDLPTLGLMYNEYTGSDRALVISTLETATQEYTEQLLSFLQHPFFSTPDAQKYLHEIHALPKPLADLSWQKLEQTSRSLPFASLVRLAACLDQHPSVQAIIVQTLHQHHKSTAEQIANAVLDTVYFEISAFYESTLSSMPRYASLLPITRKVQVGEPITLATIQQQLHAFGITGANIDAIIRKRFRIAHDGTLLPRRPSPLVSYRGSKEADDPTAQYLTHSPTTAFRYGMYGGERANNAGHHGIFEVLTPANRLGIDPNVVLAYTTPSETLIRKRFIRISGVPTVHHVIAIEDAQVREQEHIASIFSQLAALSTSGPSPTLERQIDDIAQALHQLADQGTKAAIHERKVELDRIQAALKHTRDLEERHQRYVRFCELDAPAQIIQSELVLLSPEPQHSEFLHLPEPTASNYREALSETQKALHEEISQRQHEIDALLECSDTFSWEPQYREHIFVTSNNGVSIFEILKQAKEMAKTDPLAARLSIERSGTFQFLLTEQRQIQHFRRWEDRLFRLLPSEK